MNEFVRDNFVHLWGSDRDRQYQVAARIAAAPEQPADCPYKVKIRAL